MKVNLRQMNAKKFENRQKDVAAKIWVVAQKRMYLRILHHMRFEWHFKKRLLDLIETFGGASERAHELQKDFALASVMLKELKDSSIDLCDFFDDLVEFEETEYNLAKENEYGKRCAGK